MKKVFYVGILFLILFSVCEARGAKNPCSCRDEVIEVYLFTQANLDVLTNPIQVNESIHFEGKRINACSEKYFDIRNAAETGEVRILKSGTYEVSFSAVGFANTFGGPFLLYVRYWALAPRVYRSGNPIIRPGDVFAVTGIINIPVEQGTIGVTTIGNLYASVVLDLEEGDRLSIINASASGTLLALTSFFDEETGFPRSTSASLNIRLLDK